MDSAFSVYKRVEWTFFSSAIHTLIQSKCCIHTYTIHLNTADEGSHKDETKPTLFFFPFFFFLSFQTFPYDFPSSIMTRSLTQPHEPR